MFQDDELSRLFLMAGLGMIGAPNVAQGISRGGMFALQEAVRQMRGTSPAQVDGVETSFVQGVGGMFAAAGSVILRRQ